MEKIIKWDSGFEIPDSGKTVMTLGKFDGIHLGHQKLIGLAKEKALESKEKMAVFTFINAHKRTQDEPTKFLTTEEERKRLFDELGTDYLIEAVFDERIKSLEPEDFVREVMERFHVTDFYVGPDFRFGHHRRGNLDLLRSLGRQMGFCVHEIQKKQFQNENISSTRIRKCVKECRMKEAARMLGRPYFIEGRVVPGKRIGRTLGMPTANLYPEERKFLPGNGVYVSAVFLEDGSWYHGITNIGCRPSVGERQQLNIETNIFGFSRDIYGEKIRIELLEYLRKEKKFASLEGLKEQMETDIKMARKIMAMES